MARKGQKFRKYTDEEQNIITQEYLKGKSIRYLSKKHNISLGTIKTWKRKYKREVIK